VHSSVQWVDRYSQGLLVDQYELAMIDAYLREGLSGTAAFSLFVRRLPAHRNYLVACGLAQALDVLESLSFGPDALDALRDVCGLSSDTLAWLKRFRFRGEVWAVPEGTVVFEHEPLLEVVAPLAEAQLVETMLLNQLHLQTLIASKASRIVTAAAGRDVIELGLRRAQGADAGLKGARAAYVGGAAGTSNVLAGALYGVPVKGTMAHSYVQAHDSETEAFRAWTRTYPRSTVLVDTYDTLKGVQRVVELSRELGERFLVSAVRIDSGDLLELSRSARALLDRSGLNRVRIVASGGLDEQKVAALVTAKAPIDAFGVGTALAVSEDAPSLDFAYKLVEYDGRPRIKLSADKVSLPGRKQVFRSSDGDVVGCFREALGGQRLVVPVMRDGRRLLPDPPLFEVRRSAAQQLSRLPERVRALADAEPRYRVEVSARLCALRDELRLSSASRGGSEPTAPAAPP
jgi:nicotinate phosphoribosyltransferase